VTAISVGAALGSGFSLIRRKPMTVLVWGLLAALAICIFSGAYAGMMWSFFTFAMTSGMFANSTPPPELVGEFVGRIMMGEGLFFLAVIVMVILRVMLSAAVWRAVLHPERGSWAYLRFGVPELLILAMQFAIGLLFNLAFIPLVPVMLVAGGLLAAHQVLAGAIVGVLGLLVAMVLMIYVALRFALIGPMIVEDGRFHFIDAWAITRGKVGSLFLIALALVVMVWLVELVVVLVIGGVGAAGLGVAAGGFDHLMEFAQQSPQLIVARLAPALVICAILAIPIGGAMTSIFAAPWARALLDLRAAPPAAVPPAAVPPPEPTPELSASEPTPPLALA